MNHDTGSIGSDERLALPDYGPDPEASSRRRRNVVIAVLVLLVVAIGGWYAFARGEGDGAATKAAAPGSSAPSVTVIVPGRKTVDRMLSATGTLAARREMPVGVAGEGGMITRVLVEPGSWVRAGQVLATVDRSVQSQTAQSLSAQVAVAQSDQSIAQAELDRAQQLVDRGFISKADLQRKAATRDAAAARVRVARATLGEATARNGRLDIRAPAAGLVLTRGVEPGQIVSAGSGILFRIAMNGQLEMRAQFGEADLAALRPGARAVVTPVGTTTGHAGQVWQVSPVIDASTRQGIARIALAYDPALRPGGFAEAAVSAGASTVPLLPESAVLNDAAGSYVYVIGTGNAVVRRAIKSGDIGDNGIAIVDGLNGTERVVVSAGAFLTPGQRVAPVLKKAG